MLPNEFILGYLLIIVMGIIFISLILVIMISRGGKQCMMGKF